MPISDELRQKRAENARRMHAEGRLGTRAVAKRAGQRSGEVRSARASAVAAEIVEKHRAKIEKTISDGLQSDSLPLRLRAAELAMKMGMRGEAQQTSEARVETEARTKEELVALLAAKLTAPTPTAALVRQQLHQHADVDGTARLVQP